MSVLFLGLLLAALLIIAVAIFLGTVHPIWSIVDCGSAPELPKSNKVVWIIFIVLTWGLGSLTYGLFVTRSSRLKKISQWCGLCLLGAGLVWGSAILLSPQLRAAASARFAQRWGRAVVGNVPKFPNDKVQQLVAAASDGDTGNVALLLEAGMNPNLTVGNVSPIESAAKRGHTGVVGELLLRGANPNTRGNEGMTPLMWAARGGHLPVAGLLIKNGAEVNAANDAHQTVLMMAQEKGNLVIISMLKQAGAK